MPERILTAEVDVALSDRGGREKLSTLTGVSGTQDLDLATANVFDVTTTGATTFTFTGATAGVAVGFTLILRGSGAITWPAGMKWVGGEPTRTTLDQLGFLTVDGGTEWLGGGLFGFA